MNYQGFCSILKESGINFYTGVPCSILSDIIKYLSRNGEFNYVSATREDEAIGIAVGAYMGGKIPAVLMQNSGLGNSVNALTSLVLLYKCPMLLIISWRGYQGKDEPEHALMGRYMLDFLRTMDIPTAILSKDDISIQIENSAQLVKKQQTAALVLRAGILE